MHVNELKGGAATTAHLLEFDSIHGRWREQFGAEDDRAILVGNRRIGFSAAPSPGDVAWGDLGCDIVLECTGKFLKAEQLARLFRARRAAGDRRGAGQGGGRAQHRRRRQRPSAMIRREHRLLTAASCTTNCLAPVVKVLHEAIGIRHGQITTIHDPTNTNVVVDAPHKDLRRARSAMLSLSPTTTGSATAIALIYPELKGKLNGHAVRAPVLNASLTDCVFEMARPVTADEVNALFRAAAAGPLAGILGFETRPLVSADYANDTRSAIVDGPSTHGHRRHAAQGLCLVRQRGRLCLPHGRSRQHRHRARRSDVRSPQLRHRHHRVFPVHHHRRRLRMLVLLHFYSLGYTPFMLAFLFLLYETAGIFANVGGGWLASRFGIPRMLATGQILQIGGPVHAVGAESGLGRGRIGRLGGAGAGHRRRRQGPDQDRVEKRDQGDLARRARASCSAGSRGSPDRRTPPRAPASSSAASCCRWSASVRRCG